MLMDCHIQAYGACMIGGFPHRPEDSFFHHAIQKLQIKRGSGIVSSSYTFGGFPVTRVPRHLKARCLDKHPHIVVLQFASSDLIVPIHKHHHGSEPVHRDVSEKLPSISDWFRWQIQGLIGDIRRLPPVTPLETYLQTMEQLVRTLSEHQIIPVVLSPFVFGGWRSDRFARTAAGRLQKLLSSFPGAIYVDAHAALNRHPRRKMLLKDGSHLSRAGHQIVAEVLLPGLETAVANWEKSGNRTA